MKSSVSKKIRKLKLSENATVADIQARLQEEEERKKYEEFWSDPCWTEPLSQSAG
jgi:hypothetical protein